jgi:bzd-type benzoyl-CoA reductase N subunit
MRRWRSSNREGISEGFHGRVLRHRSSPERLRRFYMSALQELLALPDRRDNPYVKEWKDAGGRIVGLPCGYVPEELIYAAGLLPYRVECRGCTETDLADIYMHRFNCTYARCILQAGLSGEYDFLDGFCFLNGCEQIRRMYEIWDKHIGTNFMYMVTVPHTINEGGFKWYTEEIQNFREDLRTNFGKRLNDESLSEAIAVYNESRRLVEKLYDMRKAKDVPISGADAMRIILSAFHMPRAKYNELLREALDEIGNSGKKVEYKARLMVGGSAMDEPQLLEIIEELGGVVVTDSLCYGSKHFLDLVEEDGDPFQAVAKRYYYHNPCPRMLGEYDNRLKFMEEMAKGADVDGVILQKIVFCDSHGCDNVMLSEDLEAMGMPVLTLEREYMLSDIGRFKTRIEAFMERIGGR